MQQDETIQNLKKCNIESTLKISLQIYYNWFNKKNDLTENLKKNQTNNEIMMT